MKAPIKVFLMFVILCSANVVWAQTSDSSDASNSDKSNKIRHGGAPGSTASYTVHDGEVRPKESGKGSGKSSGNTGEGQTANSNGETQTANNAGQTNYSDSFNQKNSQDTQTAVAAPDVATNNSNCHFCWGWLGLLGLLGLGGLIKRNPDKV